MTIECKDWHAWLDTMPPKPDEFHVSGDIIVGNPGIRPILTMRNPPGINQTILMLDLSLVQQAGMWPQVVTCAQAKFNRVMPPGATAYNSVQIFLNGEKIASIDKIEVTA